MILSKDKEKEEKACEMVDDLEEKGWDIILTEGSVYVISEEAESDIDQLDVPIETKNPNYYGALTHL